MTIKQSKRLGTGRVGRRVAQFLIVRQGKALACPNEDREQTMRYVGERLPRQEGRQSAKV